LRIHSFFPAFYLKLAEIARFFLLFFTRRPLLRAVHLFIGVKKTLGGGAMLPPDSKKLKCIYT
jgi:hypothetical protein